MKNIIVPVDFSECSIEALKVACDIARATGSKITITHWYQRQYTASLSPIFSTVASKYNTAVNDAYKDELKEKIKELEKQSFMTGIEFNTLLIFDKTVSEVFEMDEIAKSDLIIMGTKGADNIKELTIGSNTQKAVRSASTPTLAVKKYFDISKIKDVIFASDFNEKEGDEAFQKIFNLIKKLDAKLHLLKIITPTYFEDTDTSEAKIDIFVKKANLKDYKQIVYNNYSAEEGITEYSKKYEDSIICIATHGYKGFGHFINGSISEDLVNRVDKPVLSIRK